MNKLIMMEGVDGSGKSTQIKLLKQVYGSCIHFTKEPFDPAEELETLTDPFEKAAILTADRVHHASVIKPVLEQRSVICDRGPLSMMAYQGPALKVVDEWSWSLLWTLNDWAMRGLDVDATIILDIPVDKAFVRVNERAAKSVVIPPPTMEDIDEMAAAAKIYAEKWEGPKLIRWVGKPYRVNADRPVEEVHQDILKIVEKVLAS